MIESFDPTGELENYLQSYRLEKERLEQMTEVTRLLTSSLDTTTVVQTILTIIPRVIPAAEACVLFTYDPVQEKLISQASVGFNHEVIRKLQLTPGESMSGIAFARNQAMLFAGDELIEQGLHSMSPDNRQLQKNLTPVQAISIMCAPLSYKGRASGVITVNNFHRANAFNEFDLKLLQSLASQACIAIENSRLHHGQLEANRTLAELNQIVIQQHRKLERAFHIHRTLSDLVLENRGLESIVQTLARLLQQPVILLDPLQKPLAQALPENFPCKQISQNKEWWQHLETTQPEDQSDQAQLCFCRKQVTIKAGNTLLGSLVTAQVKSSDPSGSSLKAESSDLDELAIEQAATVIALELTKEQAIFEVERRLRGELLEEILNSPPDDTLASRAALLGYDSSCLYTVILADIDGFHNIIENEHLSEGQISGLKQRILNLINRMVLRAYPQSIISFRSDMVVIMLGVPGTIPPAEGKEQVRKLVAELHSSLHEYFPQVSFSIGISQPGANINQFKARYQEVQLALQMMGGATTPGKIVDCSQLGSALLLLKIQDNDTLFRFVEEVLGQIIRYDHKHRSNLLETLQTYSKYNRDLHQTAKNMHIHFNTLSYRLDRVEKLTGRKLNQTDDWLDIQLALRLYQAYPGIVTV
ncbi:MAG TPA: helix-turn-helix domain-containing protein [Chloroflexia bacterium]|nr:helix-turn-helix domain-containing protein [Chloroflexia bacterium]